MSGKSKITSVDNIQNLIFSIRGLQVMVDRDLARIYGVETRRLNEQVKRNIKRFPSQFRFQLTKEELDNLEMQIALSNDGFLRSQFATLKKGRGKHIKYTPYVYTEQGVSMLSAVLKSETAIRVSIQIIEAFVEMRKTVSRHANLFQRISNIEQKQIASDIKQIEADNKINIILDAIQERDIKPEYGIFYENQTFDAYVFVADLIKSANKTILLIDNYIDESILQLFTKCKRNVDISIYTKNFSKILEQDLEKYNSQYPAISIKKFTKSHDRFLIIDETHIYHFGASFKDLGKKWFAFSKMDIQAMEMITRISKGEAQ